MRHVAKHLARILEEEKTRSVSHSYEQVYRNAESKIREADHLPVTISIALRPAIALNEPDTKPEPPWTRPFTPVADQVKAPKTVSTPLPPAGSVTDPHLYVPGPHDLKHPRLVALARRRVDRDSVCDPLRSTAFLHAVRKALERINPDVQVRTVEQCVIQTLSRLFPVNGTVLIKVGDERPDRMVTVDMVGMSLKDLCLQEENISTPSVVYRPLTLEERMIVALALLELNANGGIWSVQLEEARRDVSIASSNLRFVQPTFLAERRRKLLAELDREEASATRNRARFEASVKKAKSRVTKLQKAQQDVVKEVLKSRFKSGAAKTKAK